MKILEAAVQAPSGSNSQPWRFEVDADKVFVWASPDRDHPILNHRYRGTWVAHGALLENLVTAANYFGYETNIKLFPDKDKANLVAEVLFDPKDKAKDEDLYQAIFSRATNRKKYEATKLTAEQKNNFLQAAKDFGRGELVLIEDKNDIKKLMEAGSANELVMFQNKRLHELFFDEVVWTKEQEKQKGKGLYIPTLEIPKPQQMALRLFKSWSIMNLLNKFGLAKSIASDNIKNFSNCAAVGAIIIDHDSDEDFVDVGRLMEKIWLLATKMGLSFHPVMGTLFFWQSITADREQHFSTHEAKIIDDAYQKMSSVINCGDKKIIVALMRIGEGGEPSARSLKLKPEITYLR